ncbi:MAG TPA: hypothetical protein VF209_00955 [Patescibacteria group bacterium]
MTKQCSHCKQVLDLSEFNWKIKDVKRAVHCRKCSREYIKKHYDRNHQYYIDKARRRNKEVRELTLEFIGNYLQQHPCVDCGETNILVLDFDHKEKVNKSDDVSRMIKRKLSYKRLIEEIVKCDVRCANCHRIKTAKENNSWRLKKHP